jgi:hypothetical protein
MMLSFHKAADGSAADGARKQDRCLAERPAATRLDEKTGEDI